MVGRRRAELGRRQVLVVVALGENRLVCAAGRGAVVRVELRGRRGELLLLLLPLLLLLLLPQELLVVLLLPLLLLLGGGWQLQRRERDVREVWVDRWVVTRSATMRWGSSRSGVERLLLRGIGRLFRHGKYSVSVTRTKRKRTRGQSLHVHACTSVTEGGPDRPLTLPPI